MTQNLQVLSVEEPKERNPGIIVESAAELVQKLRDEAKVI